MKRRISFNRLKGTLTYSGLMLPWHRDINFDKVQINAYPESFRMMIPYRLIGLSPVGEYKDAQAWWSFYMWYMDRNRPLPAGTLFTEKDREEDYLRRREMGFPDPIYNSSIDTPEWQGAISKYNDLKALERYDTIYKGSDKLAEQYRIRQAYVKANSYIKQVGSRRK